MYCQGGDRVLRQKLYTPIGWIHSTLIFSLIIPVVYAVLLESKLYHMGRLYALCLLVAVPIVLSDLIAHRSRSLFGYLIGMAVLFGASTAGAALLGNLLFGNRLYIGAVVIMAAEIIYIAIERLLIRLHERRADEKDEKNPDWRPRKSVLVHPGLFGTLVFVFAYLFGILFANPDLCNIALTSAVFYLLLAVTYQYLTETEEYLSLNKRVCNLPVKRLYGISTCACALFLLLLLVTGILAGSTAGMRRYVDVRSFASDIQPAEYEMLNETLPTENAGDNFSPEMFDMGEPKEPPAWLEPLTYMLYAAAAVFIVWMCVAGILKISRLFRETYDENGDVIEKLEETTERVEKIQTGRKSGRKPGYREEIRRRYRREIRKHRKEIPAPCESPIEIEQNAGISDTIECKELHRLYEEVRYGLPKPDETSS